MKATVSTTLTAKITLELSEAEAYALMKLSGYGGDAVADRIHEFAHGFEEKSLGRNGILSLMESAKALYAPLEEIKRIRKEGQNIKVV